QPKVNSIEKSIDFSTLGKLVKQQVTAGNDLVVCGTTGEASTLSLFEHLIALAFVRTIVTNRDTKLIAGTGSNSTAETIILTEYAKILDYDAALIVAPYYNKPTQAGLAMHFGTVASAVPNMPILLYNIASRTGVNIEPKTILELAKISNIVGIKEASGDPDQWRQIRELCGDNFQIISGNDGDAYEMMSDPLVNACGLISVASNTAPNIMETYVHGLLNGNFTDMGQIQNELKQFFDSLFIETNPAGIKKAMEINGQLNNSDLRLPLVKVTDKTGEQIKHGLRNTRIKLF
ncbi:MAG: 4-hydroxy-tetrahydrodipicolinate synthase, partial [Candidatus Diapherotrites archaeon]|nr:4-hydroxy-tetrahydrodipicolinate synthase [Candidatus Diapherotrites archaeon]